jgi:hypothetical protein
VAPKFGLGPAELAKRVAAETEYWKSHYGKEVERSSSRLRSREATASELAHVVEGLAKSTVARLEAEATAEQLAGALRGLYDAAPEVHQDPRAKWGSVCEAAREALKSHKHGTALAEHDAKVRADERERAFTILHDGIVREKGEASLAEHDAKVVTDAAGAQCERDWNAFGRILVGLNEPIPPPTATALAEHDRKLRSQVLGEVVDWFERNHEPEPAELVRQLRRIHELRTGPIPTTFETEHAEKWLAEHDKALTDRIAKLMDGMELAWGVIANAGGGDWDLERPEWKEAAIRWRDEHWHPAVGVARALTKEPRK